MPVNFLNLPGLEVIDFKETEAEYHVRATPRTVSRLCPHCGRSHETVAHAKRTLVIRDIPSHGKAVVVHLDVTRLKCRPCNQTFTASVPVNHVSRILIAVYLGRINHEIRLPHFFCAIGRNQIFGFSVCLRQLLDWNHAFNQSLELISHSDSPSIPRMRYAPSRPNHDMSYVVAKSRWRLGMQSREHSRR